MHSKSFIFLSLFVFLFLSLCFPSFFSDNEWPHIVPRLFVVSLVGAITVGELWCEYVCVCVCVCV